jgi:hypothetical protein
LDELRFFVCRKNLGAGVCGNRRFNLRLRERARLAREARLDRARDRKE